MDQGQGAILVPARGARRTQSELRYMSSSHYVYVSEAADYEEHACVGDVIRRTDAHAAAPAGAVRRAASRCYL